MRALTLQGSQFQLEDLPDPVPGAGQLLVAPFFNGICGSDLHQRHMMADREKAAGRAALPKYVLGHEFSGEIVAIGRQSETVLKVGDRVVSVPFTTGNEPFGLSPIGLSPAHTGGMAALTLVDATRSFKVPDTVPSDLAALTEPLSVGRHAVNLANRRPGPNLILGCGPIGLAVLLALRRDGRGPIVAVDFSAERRRIAGKLGADLVIDPCEGSPYTGWTDIEFHSDLPSPLMDREFQGYPRGLNVFECTGSASVFAEILRSAPRHSHVIYAGVCMHEVAHVPMQATMKEMTVEYCFAYTPSEFRETLAMIASDPETVGKLVTSRTRLADTEAAFDRLSGTSSEIKVLIDVRA